MLFSMKVWLAALLFCFILFAVGCEKEQTGLAVPDGISKHPSVQRDSLPLRPLADTQISNCSKVLIGGIGFSKVYIHPQDDSLLFAVRHIENTSLNEVFVSRDGGISWFGEFKANALAFDVDPDIIYAINNYELLRSDDKGRSFKQVRRFDSYAESIFADRFVSGKLYVGMHGSGWGVGFLSDKGESYEFRQFNDSIKVPEEYQKATEQRIIWAIEQDLQDPNVLVFSGEDSRHSLYSKTGQRPWYPVVEDPYYVIFTRDGGKTFFANSKGLTWHSVDIGVFVENKTTRWIAATEGHGAFWLNGVWDKSVWEKSGSGTYYDYQFFHGKHYGAVGYSLRESKDGIEWNDLTKGGRISSFAINSKGRIFYTDYLSALYLYDCSKV